MADEKKSYMVDMSMEILTENDEKVKAIRLHGVKNELMPLRLLCDFLERIERMTPYEKVMLVTGEKHRPLVEKDKYYAITGHYGDFIPGDIFKGIGDYELEHVRTGEIVRVNRDLIDEFFEILVEFDPRWTEPISPETMEMISKAREYNKEG